MRTRRCIGRLVDEGALRGTALALSPDDSLLAAGSDAGVVNVYSRDKAALTGLLGDDARPLAAAVTRPIKTLMNLTTAIDNLAFSPDGQVGCRIWHWGRDCLLTHVTRGILSALVDCLLIW